MKKFFTLMGAMLLVALLGLCAGCKDSPKQVVVKWQKALVKGDMSEATKYCDQHGARETAKVFEMMSSPRLDEDDRADLAALKTTAPTDETITGNDATVTVGKEKIQLKQVDGKWKINNL